jgi:predicted GNAT family acetyltransferase
MRPSHSLDSPMSDTPAVTLNAAANRFEIATPVGKAVLKFALDGDVIDLEHTSVPDALKGGGYGSALARAALDHARQNQLKVVPTCKFVRAFMQRHKEYDDLRATKT